MITADYTTILQCAVTSYEGIKQPKIGGANKKIMIVTLSDW
jgi:hypothetical protein